MTILWTSDAYGTGDFSLWTAQQEIAADRCQVVTPPAEVGDGPQNRSYLGRFRIEPGDLNPAGSGGQRAEVYRSNVDNVFGTHVCQGSDIWLGWETYFGDPGVVADTNAYRPCANTSWNHFIQFHQAAGLTTQPFSVTVDTRAGSLPSQWRFAMWTRGGPESTAPTSLVISDCGAFSYGWHEFRVYIYWGQANGRAKLWIDNVLVRDYTGPVGFNPDSAGTYCNYLKQGCYRSGGNASTTYSAGLRIGTTEEDVLPDTPVPPEPVEYPAPGAPYQFGLLVAGLTGQWLGDFGDYKRGSPFTVPANCGEISAIYEYVRGNGDVSPRRVAVYAMDDGGAPGTLLGVSDEVTIDVTDPADWVAYTFSTPLSLYDRQGQSVLLCTINDGANYASETWAEGATGQEYLRADVYATGPSDPWDASVGGGSTGTYDWRLALCAVYLPEPRRLTTRARSAVTRTIDATKRIAGLGGGGI